MHPGQPDGFVMLPFIVNLVPFIILILIGYTVGRIIELRHLKDLRNREDYMTAAIPTNLKSLPDVVVLNSFLVVGSVVVASDYYKTIGAQLKSLVGGRLLTLESMMSRARREAILRMREQAAYSGAQLVLNVRVETSSIARSERRAGMPSIEVVAYGTAIMYEQ